jgi:nucleoid DNA-binding protein
VEKMHKHIEKLLAKHDYVVVPTLGGFVVQTESAIILENRIIAPKAILAFNPLMQHIDGLLAIEIAKSESISYRQSIELIEKEVEKIKSELKSFNNVPFGNLGSLALKEENNLIFTPAQKPDFLPKNTGLTDIFIQQKSRNTQQIKSVTFTLPSKSVFQYAASAVIIFCLLFISPIITDKHLSNKADFSSILQTKASHNINISAKAETATKTMAVDTLTQVTPAQKFHVVVASLATEKSAADFCTELVNNNFTKAHTLTPSHTYRIAIQSFDNKTEAISFMEKLRNTDSRFETAWVYCEE